jgi:hypothetical protein
MGALISYATAEVVLKYKEMWQVGGAGVSGYEVNP